MRLKTSADALADLLATGGDLNQHRAELQTLAAELQESAADLLMRVASSDAYARAITE